MSGCNLFDDLESGDYGCGVRSKSWDGPDPWCFGPIFFGLARYEIFLCWAGLNLNTKT